MPLWRPKNYKHNLRGMITMREGLERSCNLITVRVAGKVGIPKVAEIIKRYGINNNPQMYYSMVLGSLETTLQKMTNAYAMIANGGYRIMPQYIEMIQDRNGNVIYKRDTYYKYGTNSIKYPINRMDIIDEATNYQMISFLEGVIERGSGVAARKLNSVIAGKTGTTNDSKDTWFMGFTPNIVVGTYVGYDIPKDMGKNATGTSVALPIFIDFMQNALKVYPSEVPFTVPSGIQFVNIDRKSGMISDGPGSIKEAFKQYNNANNAYLNNNMNNENGIFNSARDGTFDASNLQGDDGEVFDLKIPDNITDDGNMNDTGEVY
jgi:penicillin-binding protein 1A